MEFCSKITHSCRAYNITPEQVIFSYLVAAGITRNNAYFFAYRKELPETTTPQQTAARANTMCRQFPNIDKLINVLQQEQQKKASKAPKESFNNVSFNDVLQRANSAILQDNSINNNINHSDNNNNKDNNNSNNINDVNDVVLTNNNSNNNNNVNNNVGSVNNNGVNVKDVTTSKSLLVQELKRCLYGLDGKDRAQVLQLIAKIQHFDREEGTTEVLTHYYLPLSCASCAKFEHLKLSK